MDYENHMVMRDRAYEQEMSDQYWTDLEEQTCPMCNGDCYIANRCKCGTMPSIEEDECALCGAPIHWKTCPCCLGKGVIYG